MENLDTLKLQTGLCAGSVHFLSLLCREAETEMKHLQDVSNRFVNLMIEERINMKRTMNSLRLSNPSQLSNV